MWTTKKKIQYILYKITSCWLPETRHFPFAGKLRRFWANKIIEQCGKNVNVERGASFTPDLIIGDNSGIGINCELWGPVSIGKDVLMGPDVIVYTSEHRHERVDIPMREQGDTAIRSVMIGDDVWIGRRAVIMPGVVIGKGTVIGAGAVVTKSIPEYCVAGGVPARILKSRISGGAIIYEIIVSIVNKINYKKVYLQMEVAS